jgi:hypothetical protein
MRLSQSEIRSNAIAFAADWKDVSSERAEAQTFWNEFFAVFGIKRRSVASFEEKVRNVKAKYDRIDVFYSGVMLGEHKSRGEDLTAAASQAFDYVQSLTRAGRAEEAPQFIVVSDFARIVVYDLETNDPSKPVADFETAKLHENIRALGFISGYDIKPLDPEDPVNIEAVEILGKLHDALEKGGYSGHELERFLVRILFCLFAEDTGIFDPDAFTAVVKATHADGRDLGPILARLFKVLDTEKASRPRSLPEEFKELPYVNGGLFAEDLEFADFDKAMRDALIACCEKHWAKISPAVFGSLFQSIMAGEAGVKKRRQIGAHYTSERDIMKLVRSLFLDDLKAELEACGKDKKKLRGFQDKLASLRFLDPACGCGNFLVVTYRELRLLELEALLRLYGGKYDAERLLLDSLLKVDVDQMHGIEIEEWPARIAEVAMWLIDHQMNQKVGEAFGQPVLRLPLKKSAKIILGNALQIDWNDVLPAKRCSYVLGNPPFVGKKEQNAEQKKDMETIWNKVKGAGVLDYVTCWHRTAAKYSKGTTTTIAFVSTNSICQGEQVGVVWKDLLVSQGVSIRFAHNTFSWMSEARGKAHVHVVIVGFGPALPRPKLWDYSDDEKHPTCADVGHLSPYLVEGPDVFLGHRSTPLCNVPAMSYGSMMIDRDREDKTARGLMLTAEERTELLAETPAAAPFIRRLYGAEEFLNGGERWCLWLVDAPPNLIRSSPMIRSRVEGVRRFREGSDRSKTRELAATPGLFGERRQPTRRYLLIPKVASERRDYLPLGFMEPSDIASGSALVLPESSLLHFGVLSSAIHMAWMRRVCGRMKSDYQYSSRLVYNNFPWPQNLNDKQKAAVEAAAQAVLDARDTFNGQTLADLYDPLSMPKALRDAHKGLDRAVDKCYRAAPFGRERSRVEYLFTLYQQLVNPLTASAKTGKPSKTK